MTVKMVQFNDLLSLFPKCDGPASFPLETSSPHFRYEQAENTRFVAPTLRREQEAAETKCPSVILISAPAAVGKSTVAQAIAQRLGAPLWDLSKFTLGHGALSGVPRKYLGSTAFNDVESKLRAGEFLYVLDALDEARARPGSGFESFLEEVCDEARSARPKASLVLLGRSEASLWASLFLEKNKVSFAHYTIEFFGRSQAEEFIDKYLDWVAERKKRIASHRNQRDNFTKARDLLFSRVFKVLGTGGNDADPWDVDPVREFLGYAPVLEVLADFLDEPNYHKLNQEMSRLGEGLIAADQNGAWKFLQEIVNGLLSRERDKLVNPFRKEVEEDAKAAGWNAWGSLYSDDEQCERVLRKSFKLGVPTLPKDLPPKLRQSYNEAINISDHAFVKDEYDFTNVVFRDYLYAWALRNGAGPTKETVEKHLKESDYRPTPLLAHFYLALDEDEQPAPVEAGHLGFVYESILSKESASQQVVFRLEPEDEGRLYATFDFGKSNTADILFSVTGTDQTIVFPRFLRDADINFRAAITLGTSGTHFDLGPAVRVECDVIRTVVPELRVLTKSSEEGGDVVLEAERYEPEGGAPPKELIVKGDGALSVSWKDVAHPWAPHRYTPESRSIDDPRLVDALKRFASILSPFEGGGFGKGLTKSKKLIDNRPVGRTPMGKALHQHLLDEGILSVVDGGLYRLDMERLSNLQFPWHMLKRREMSDALRNFLTAFLEQHPDL